MQILGEVVNRIGMITPSSNTVLEPTTATMLHSFGLSLTVHFSRLRVTRIALDAEADRQFEREALLSAADLLADARIDVIAWNGTSASWLGFETDRLLCEEIERRTGRPSTSAVLGLNALIKEKGIGRLALVTPYTADVEDRIAANYRSLGIEVVACRHAGLSDNFAFGEVDDDAVARMCEEVALARPDAIAIVCTNMRGALIASWIESQVRVMVLDSVSATLWASLRAIGCDTARLAAFGSMFCATDETGQGLSRLRVG